MATAEPVKKTESKLDNISIYLKSVFAPQITGVPPTNPIHDLMMLPDGEIRHYGFRGNFRQGTIQTIFISSQDYGFSWIEKNAPLPSPGGTVLSPWSGDFLTVLCSHGTPSLEEYQSIHTDCRAPGIYIHRSSHGPDGPFESRRIGDLLPRLLIPRQPLALRSRKRWILAAHGCTDGQKQQSVVLFISDDDAHSWKQVHLPLIPGPGLHWPHAGLRWENCGAEPTVAELTDGRLYMLIRSSHDRFWEAYSSDGGDSWTGPVPSRFYGTITTPLLFLMSDGRLLVFWNNTTPLPEVDHSLQHGLTEDERAGVWEDIFTNRDALHAAISSDNGKTWSGFREIHLNERRNDSDFRSRKGNDSSVDKSIHQSQALELPGGKILLAFGQHEDCRKLIVFNPDWLYENDRTDDFRLGLEGWSYHQYLKSVAGGYRGFTGHCSLNRRPGPALIPHPDGEMREVLQVARYPDERLLDEQQGAVWNFPNGRAGRLRLRLFQPKGSSGAHIALLDRWFNPCDPVVHSFSQFVLHLDAQGSINGIQEHHFNQWFWLNIDWNLDQNSFSAFSIDDGSSHPLEIIFPCSNGLSYLHLQGAKSSIDPFGVLVEKVEKTGA